MSDVSKFTLNGRTINVKDAIARQSASSNALNISTNTEKITEQANTLKKLTDNAVKVSYTEDEETIIIEGV